MTTEYTPKPLPAPFTELLTEIEQNIASWPSNQVSYYNVTIPKELLRKVRDLMRTLLDHGTDNADRDSWVSWLLNYGPGKFYDAFVSTAQGAESVCTFCHEAIFLDIVEGGGVPDWRNADDDCGCWDKGHDKDNDDCPMNHGDDSQCLCDDSHEPRRMST